MPVLSVQHVTTYSYRRPVSFGEHRMMFRPRDSAEQRVLSWRMQIAPEPVAVRSSADSFGNVITRASFGQRSRELRVENRLIVEHLPQRPDHAHIAPQARIWPFSYDLDDVTDLAPVIRRHYPDPEHRIDAWARSFLTVQTVTLDLLTAITREIKYRFAYVPRHEEGVQEPARTLSLRAGTCRDYAILMMEALRALGLAARFVTGYIYSPATGARPRQGDGATHAWVEVFVPGAGWIDLDPTNGIVGSRDLIRVASVRDPSQAVPLAGTWTGFPADSLGMDVTVHVSSDEDGAEPGSDGAATHADVVNFAPRDRQTAPTNLPVCRSVTG